MQNDAKPAPAPEKPGQDKPAPAKPEPGRRQTRFVDADPPRPAPLGRLRTDEEARLAAEIEKLR